VNEIFLPNHPKVTTNDRQESKKTNKNKVNWKEHTKKEHNEEKKKKKSK
jgi:hypothetical protein